ncbi:glycosyl hydrolases family 32 superfamily [Talaromyces proteolyticus]|uniref:Glycosyl hydrolases family 32 superfamily n=1 Tax=Talaromyces proteolyticus TaxID=1131652 RepID=A0AAD4PU29_9EURO|nr:glycosyl hydrolases family 32 superfamily [Talaromyces proteolyticus]KAH8689611.1 glycosyl hydrolases family 32 superfamily [Talaromyces proteolyticus]
MTTTSSKWRPTFHLNAPSGWLNDPCGLGYDPSTRLYHVAFQWNPRGNDWGNVSWGNSTSYDMVSWKTSPDPYLTPSTDYDCYGIFTGCLRPTDIDGSPGALTCIYTSVKHLPIHYTLPYVQGCESLSLAVSHDSGLTWRRLSCNPILSGPPCHLQVTGWRDPFVCFWRGSSMQLSQSETGDHLYGFLSGGVVGETPTVFVYIINPNDLRDWKFIGCLVDVGLNFRPSRWSGDFGVNWEVANVLELSSEEDGISRTFVIVGAEGCLQSKDDVTGSRIKAQTARTPRQQLWMALKAKSSDDASSNSALATYSFAGIFDHGCYYAANSFYDPVTGRHVFYGWVTEEDLPDNLRHAQGWSGLISLPRTVQLQVLHNIVRARSSKLQTITSIETEADSRGTYTVRTLGTQPDDRLKKLRAKASSFTLQNLTLHSSCSADSIMTLKTSRWEVEARFAVHKQCTRAGIQITHSAKLKTSTVLTWEPLTENFTVERPHPTYPGINHGVESAPHTLFTFRDVHDNEVEETLRIRAIFDKSILEVFINERTALSTRIYLDEDRCSQLGFFAEGGLNGDKGFLSSPAAVLLEAQVWDGLEA